MSRRASPSPATPADLSTRRNLAIVAVALSLIAFQSPLLAQGSAAVSSPDAAIFGTTREAGGIDQAAAERIFARSEAAIYFPEHATARWFDAVGEQARSRDAAAQSLQDFRDGLERDFFGVRANAFGPYLMKLPAITPSTGAEIPTARITPSATILSESFENGLGNWETTNNTLDLYDWGTTSCEARSGSHSADALRGGINTLSCTGAYAANVETTMIHNACEAIAGAGEAWLDLYVHVATESGYDTLGLYYAAATGQRYGYAFSGTWSAWFHVVFNLKQWYRVGDVTATSCPSLMIQFESDADTESGIGARIDDLTISTTAPSFLACSISASPATGAAPLAVNFTPVVNGLSASTTYLWSFGDAAGTSASTPTASFTYTEPGDYQARLRVEDQGIRAYAHKTIHVTSGSSCNLSCTSLVPSSAIAGSPSPFQSTATASGCSESPTFSWTFGDGQSSSQQNPSHVYSTTGTFSWTVTIRASGQTCTRSGSITVSSSGLRPRRRGVRRSDDTIASATIGTSGGTLAGGGFTLTVPAGAFTANVSLTLSRIASPVAGRGEVSDRFRLSGLPAALARDLAVEIELPSSAPPLASGRKYYVSIDAPVYIDHSETIAPFRLLATVSGRKLSVPIPKNWTASSRTTATNLGITPDFELLPNPEIQANMFATVESEHFTAFVPSEITTDTSVILNLLESHFRKLEDLGFSFGCRVASGTFRKIEVSPTDLGTGDTDPFGVHVSRSSPCGAGWIFNDYLQITTSYAATDQRVDFSAGHELFHLLQDIYSPGGARANLWLKEASSIWYELVFGNPCPDVQSAYQMFPWNGLFNSKKSAAPGDKPTDIEAHHGYGASYFLWHHSRQLSDPFVYLIWQFIRQGSSEVAALQSAMGSTSLAEYWATFARDYFNGAMSGGCPVSWASFPKESITDQSLLPKSVKIPASPLSARSWNLDLRNFSASAAQPVMLTAAGLVANQSAYVYDVKARAALAELTKDAPSYSIDDLNSKKGTILVIVIVDRNLPTGDANSQSSTNEVTVTIEPRGGDATLIYSVLVPERPSQGGCSYALDGEGFFTPTVMTTWNGTAFQSSSSSSYGEITVTGAVSADRRTLVSLQSTFHNTVTSASGGMCPNGCKTERWITLSVANVPASGSWQPTRYSFGASGATARGLITSWSHRRADSGYSDSSFNFDCTFSIDDSRVSSTSIAVGLSPPP